MNKQYRIEIIANHAVESDLFDRFEVYGAATSYTRFSPVFGKGRSGERRGDHIWPEENVMLLIFCDDEEKESIMNALKDVKSLFPNEGIKLYISQIDAFDF